MFVSCAFAAILDIDLDNAIGPGMPRNYCCRETLDCRGFSSYMYEYLHKRILNKSEYLYEQDHDKSEYMQNYSKPEYLSTITFSKVLREMNA